MFTCDAMIRMTDSEYLHYASLGQIPGVDSTVVNRIVIDHLSHSIGGLAAARLELVTDHQVHESETNRQRAAYALCNVANR